MAIKLRRGARIKFNLSPGFQWVKQKNTNLCWAACIEMLLHALKGIDKDQYEIYEEGLNLTMGACAKYTCNAPLLTTEVKQVFSRLQLSSEVDSNHLAQDTLIGVLDRPVAVRCSDSTDQGHLLLIVAHVQADKFVVLDPWPDYSSGGITYQYILNCHPRGTWEWTWFNIE